VDSWYTECKLDLPPGSLNSKKSFTSPKPVPIKIAPDLISFHYISERESTLLYNILHANEKEQSTRTGREHGPSMSPDELYDAWPRGNSEVGHYSRPMRDKDEAATLHRALFDYITVSDGFTCWR
jgi:hypothetical protein